VGTRRGGRNSVLPGAGFGNDPRLSHLSCKQDLPDAVVDLVSTRVIEIFAFKINARTAEFCS